MTQTNKRQAFFRFDGITIKLLSTSPCRSQRSVTPTTVFYVNRCQHFQIAVYTVPPAQPV